MEPSNIRSKVTFEIDDDDGYDEKKEKQDLGLSKSESDQKYDIDILVGDDYLMFNKWCRIDVDHITMGTSCIVITTKGPVNITLNKDRPTTVIFPNAPKVFSGIKYFNSYFGQGLIKGMYRGTHVLDNGVTAIPMLILEFPKTTDSLPGMVQLALDPIIVPRV